MANLTKGTNLSLASVLPSSTSRISGLTAGEALAKGDACYIKSDGLVWRSNGTSANAAARFKGLAATACAVGEGVTLLSNCAFDYGSSLTPGADYYVSATAGALSDSSTTGGTTPVAFALTATKIFILPLN